MRSEEKCLIQTFLQSALEIEHGQLDFVLLVFCLSAISPEHFPDAIGRLHKMLKPGGMILLRDYGLGDAAQERFAKDNADKKLGENFYVRFAAASLLTTDLYSIQSILLSIQARRYPSILLFLGIHGTVDGEPRI
jgi:SAM-dependent methyltransferase